MHPSDHRVEGSTAGEAAWTLPEEWGWQVERKVLWDLARWREESNLHGVVAARTRLMGRGELSAAERSRVLSSVRILQRIVYYGTIGGAVREASTTEVLRGERSNCETMKSQENVGIQRSHMIRFVF